MRNLFRPIWKIISNDGNEVIVVCSYLEAINQAKSLFNTNFDIKLCCKGL